MRKVSAVMNPIGIHLSYWTSHWSDSVLPLLDRAKRAGFDGAELPVLDPAHMDFRAIRRRADDLGMRLTCCTGLPADKDICSPDPRAQRRGIDHLMLCLDGAAQVSSPVLAGVTYLGWGAPVPNGDPQPHIRRSIKVLQRVAEEAGARQVVLCLEVLNRYESYFLNTVAEGLRILRDVQSPHVKLNLDTYHMNIEEDDIALAVRDAGEELGHLHCAANNRKRPGLGHIPWREVGRALVDIHYGGWLVMESFVGDWDEVGRTMRTWRSLSTDRDVDAREGANFLRSMCQER